jgi:hypothetical protein
MIVFPALEAILGLCGGCKVFGVLMKLWGGAGRSVSSAQTSACARANVADPPTSPHAGQWSGPQLRQISTTARSSLRPARAAAQIRVAPPAKPSETRRSASPSIRSMPTVRSRKRVSMTPSV